MARPVPTLQEVREAVLSDADALLAGVDARLARGLLSVLLMAPVGAIHEVYGYLQRLADDQFADTASREALERIASLYGLARGSATHAQGWVGSDIQFTGLVVPLGAVLRRSDGVEFEHVSLGFWPNGDPLNTNGVSVVASIVGIHPSGWAIPVRALEPGEAGNTAGGSDLSFVSPVEGFPPILQVRNGLTGAVDEEGDEAFRARLLARLRNPPQGGTAAEYKAWALASSTNSDAITRAFVSPPPAGSNVVTVYVVDDGGGFPSARPPTPSPAAISAAEDYINARRPLSADLNLVAPTLTAAAMTIALSPDLPETRVAIENEIDAFLFDNHAPGQEIPLSLLQAAIATAAGGADAQLTAPANNFTPAAGELFYRGAITWA